MVAITLFLFQLSMVATIYLNHQSTSLRYKINNNNFVQSPSEVGFQLESQP